MFGGALELHEMRKVITTMGKQRKLFQHQDPSCGSTKDVAVGKYFSKIVLTIVGRREFECTEMYYLPIYELRKVMCTFRYYIKKSIFLLKITVISRYDCRKQKMS